MGFTLLYGLSDQMEERLGAAEAWVISLAASPMPQLRGGCKNSVAYLGAAFPGTQDVLGCAVALELMWGPCSLSHCTSEAAKVCPSS